MASKSWHRNKKGEWVKHRFTAEQRAAYWKKKYFACKKKYDADQRFMRSII